jgi:hypothetical protein
MLDMSGQARLGILALSTTEVGMRKQRHEAGLKYAQQKIEEKQVTLDDLASMMCDLEAGSPLSVPHIYDAMWSMLDRLVWKLVDEIATIDRMVCKVLRSNKDHDEDEAWKSWWGVNDEEFDWVQGRRNSPLPVFFGESS